ncbi:MAG: tRNA (N(6)-L-threonylcarbamoyladenosine(37)-C(2))-methylthiotransferase MtaB [Syntrophobacteraceae bacterium]|nr:tRNA (N(6)-L-threonylcarbamoyladenosine(37)-C(2))-methylthiotransferase MtaB [Syntrophobacteraceae bacterium]
MSQPTTAAVETLGCKVNQYDSAYFLELLTDAGYRIVPFREGAGVFVVHSCAVTAKAAFQTRQLLRRAQRQNPEAAIVVAGCNAQMEPGRFAKECLATHILGTQEKFDLLDFLQRRGSFSSPVMGISDPRTCTTFRAAPLRDLRTGRARAFVKVQDGCDAFCTYCVVPLTRGKSRSLPPQEVGRQITRFAERGFNEVVLTGIHLGQWGTDLDPAWELSQLLCFLNEVPVPPRIRLSSLEPMEMTPTLLQDLARYPWICPHFHVPLQSGDAEILARMGRPYSPYHYADVILALRSLHPEASIGADVMVGFPGEGDRHFQNTCDLVARLPLTYLHVFPFSPRPGTPAASWPDRGEGQELRRRVRHLRELGLAKKNDFQSRFVKKQVRALVESRLHGEWWQGTSDNYLKIRLSSKRELTAGLLVNVHCERAEEGGLVGRVQSVSNENGPH